MTPLRKIRLDNDLTLESVASAVNTTAANLSRIETGEQTTSAALAESLAEFFGRAITEEMILYPERFAIEELKEKPALAGG